MAKRKKKSGVNGIQKRRRRRKISGIGAASPVITALMFRIGGGILANVVSNKLLGKSTMNDKIKAGIPLAAGIGLAMFMKNSPVGYIGEGMAVVGGANTLRSVVPSISAITDVDIAGIEEEITIEDDIINGEESEMLRGGETIQSAAYVGEAAYVGGGFGGESLD